ncbi:MAG: DUF4838 domain-containing protein [Oscillospiraceae bacterium]|jgi:hypothetical protein|nr:DUF4838 domain-containing protein [Oscillospiraceae bacterium]
MSSGIHAFLSGFFSLLLIFSSWTGMWQEPQPPVLQPPQAVETMNITGDYVIVTSSEATQAERNATETLQNYLRQMSGLTLPIVLDSENYEKEIVVGITSREGALYTVDRTALGNEGVFIKTVGDSVVITGGALRGTLYAVYTFLEDYLGCRWFTQEVSVIPEVAFLEIPAEIDYLHIPALEYRETDWISPRYREWSIANKINGLTYSPVGDEAAGGGIGYAFSNSHTLRTGDLIKNEDYDAFPEMQAQGSRSGARTKDHPCLSAEKTYEIVLNNVFNWLERYPDRQIISVTQPDNRNYCVCDACSAVYEEEGSPAGLMLRFVNRIGDAVAERYPERDIAVDTFAYQYTRKAPSITVPRDNVIVRLCSIECCFVHSLDNPECGQNTEFMQDLRDWSAICNRLYVWDYTTNYPNLNGPFNNWAVMQPNMKTFVENNVAGVYEEGNYQAAESNGEFGDLRSYILAKLLWDADTDVNRHMIEFSNAYYGDAAEYILRYLTLVTSKAGLSVGGELQHMGIGEHVNNDGVMKLGVNDVTLY